MAAAVEQVKSARLVSMNDLVCPGDRCWPVIGNVLVYRSGSHITATYVASLTDMLEARLLRAAEELGVTD